MRKKIYGIIYLFVVAVGITTLHAQQNYASQLSVANQRVEKQDQTLHIAMDIDASALHINSQHVVVISPVISAKATAPVSRTLKPLGISGSVRHKVLNRYPEEKKQILFGAEPIEVIRHRNGAPQIIAYRTSVAMEDWMKNAELTLDIFVTGCADCKLEESRLTLASRLLPEPFVPTYKLTYIVPEVEPVKHRCDECVAYLNYKVARSEILPELGNNAKELEMVNKTISEAQSDKSITITNLAVSGYASPEGSNSSNMRLSEHRSRALALYITNRYGIAQDSMHIKWYGEDWNGLEEAVKKSDLADKQAILHIIRTINDPDARDAHLKKLSRGETYKILLREYYPPLRRNEYRINYTVRPFNVEEARQIIKTKPLLLSLNEMYMVAESYRAGSNEFREVFEIAARFYPDSEIALFNLAAADIDAGNARRAAERLEKIKNNSKAWNNLGVAYARMGNTEKAKEYFDKAAQHGDGDAAHNVAQLKRYVDEK